MANVLRRAFSTPLGGMIRYEVLLHWRQRGLLVVLFTMILLGVLTVFSLSNSGLIQRIIDQLSMDVVSRSQTVIADGQTTIQTITQTPDTPKNPAYISTQAFSVTAWPIAYIMLLILVPMVAADAIARDRKYRVTDLLDSTPLSSALYLFGKILGLFAAEVGLLLVVMILYGGLWRVAVGAFDIPSYIALWLVSTLPMLFINPSLIVLLASGQNGRRSALLIGFAACFAMFFFLGIGLSHMRTVGTPALWDYVNPVHPLVFEYFGYAPVNVSLQSITIGDAWLSWLIGAGELALVAWAAWAWLNRRKANS